MSTNNDPFHFWQQFWHGAVPQSQMIPFTEEDFEKKIFELKNIEAWLNFNLQAVRSQIMMMEQQKQFVSMAQSMTQNIMDSIDKMANPQEDKKDEKDNNENKEDKT
ncbi:MAG: hypothetical protein IK065_05550 [Neisseriaceae bacterium]|nr:hypothetical protein [Neisseriaceae bacterium]